MNDKDWEAKVILQTNNNFIEHVLSSRQEWDDEVMMIEKLDGIDRNEAEWERKQLLLEEAKSIISCLSVESQRVLISFVNSGKYDTMSKDLGCSISTAWKKWKKVQKEIEEIRNGRR